VRPTPDRFRSRDLRRAPGAARPRRPSRRAPAGIRVEGDLQGATDVVAFRDENLAIFAECTAKIPPPEKIRDLTARADAFQRRVKEAHGQPVVLARAMFMTIPKKDVTDALVERAHEDKVLLVAQ
jgi:hypothetical protein